ncbi:hypothetical protein C5167_037984 [Papaver somniferum]|uniref:Uncharacterized protein n=1 Tax=Papaver somniferum TaxID=3469 RepID=A0A4Y7IB43_PAPSO|nr:hypothetical protein C5167_037984 [Papaver somniferum]
MHGSVVQSLSEDADSLLWRLSSGLSIGINLLHVGLMKTSINAREKRDISKILAGSLREWMKVLTPEVNFVRRHDYSIMVALLAVGSYCQLLKRGSRGMECWVMLANDSVGETSIHEWLEEMLMRVNGSFIHLGVAGCVIRSKTCECTTPQFGCFIRNNQQSRVLEAVIRNCHKKESGQQLQLSKSTGIATEGKEIAVESMLPVNTSQESSKRIAISAHDSVEGRHVRRFIMHKLEMNTSSVEKDTHLELTHTSKEVISVRDGKEKFYVLEGNLKIHVDGSTGSECRSLHVARQGGWNAIGTYGMPWHGLAWPKLGFSEKGYHALFGNLGRLGFASRMEGWPLIVARLRFGIRIGKADMVWRGKVVGMPLAHVAWHALAWPKLGFWAKGYHALFGDLGRLGFASRTEGWPLIIARLRFGSRIGKDGMIWRGKVVGMPLAHVAWHALAWFGVAKTKVLGQRIQGWSLIVARLRFGSRIGKDGMHGMPWRGLAWPKLGFWAKGYHALFGDIGRLGFASRIEGWPLIVAPSFW